MQNFQIESLTRYPLRTAAIAFVAIGFVTAIPKLTAQVNSSNRANQIRLDAQSEARTGEAENDAKLKFLQVRDKLAVSRYEQGCLFVSDPNDTSVLTTIEEGRPVGQAGSTTGAKLPDGSVVCDANGNTGIVAGGVVNDVAFTGSNSVAKAAYERFVNPSSGGKQ